MMPWKTGKTCKNAYCILELPAGIADQLHLAVGNPV